MSEEAREGRGHWTEERKKTVLNTDLHRGMYTPNLWLRNKHLDLILSTYLSLADASH